VTVSRVLDRCSGERLAFGHYYLRPHETFHEPTRRFFNCELFRVPLYDLIPLDAVVGICCVMDLHTYCRVSFVVELLLISFQL